MCNLKNPPRSQRPFLPHETITPVSAATLADSISVDLPRDGVRAVRAARDTSGAYLTIRDEEIIQGIAELGKIWDLC